MTSGGCGGSQVEQIDAKNYFLEAQEALRQGDTTKAIAAFTASIESKPNAWAYMERAKLYAAAGQGEQALQDAQKAVELEPDNADTRLARDRVEEACRTAVQRDLRVSSQRPQIMCPSENRISFEFDSSIPL